MSTVVDYSPPSRGASLAFLGSDLGAGRGVGDLVRNLAREIEARGGRCLVIDRRQFLGPSFGAQVKVTLDSAEPGLIGLHLVPYAWAWQGVLPAKTIRELVAACASRPVVVYLHELWIGEARREPLKHRLIGALQRRGVRRLLAALHPTQVLTSNPVYASMLEELGFPAEVLPLPGNLPPVDARSSSDARAWLAARGAPVAEARAALFGTIHPEWRGEEAVASWCADAARRGLTPRILALGRLGSAAPARLAALRAAAPALRIDEAGELPAPLLAGLLVECEIAFATSPWALIGKSGSAAAFLEAGLPTLVTRDDWRRRRGPTPLPSPRAGLRLWPQDGRAFDWPDFLAARPPAGPTIDCVAETWIRLAR